VNPFCSDGLCAMASRGRKVWMIFFQKFGDFRPPRIVGRLIEGLRMRGREFSLTLLTIDCGPGLAD